MWISNKMSKYIPYSLISETDIMFKPIPQP